MVLHAVDPVQKAIIVTDDTHHIGKGFPPVIHIEGLMTVLRSEDDVVQDLAIACHTPDFWFSPFGAGGCGALPATDFICG